jgi:hypothetical protein
MTSLETWPRITGAAWQDSLPKVDALLARVPVKLRSRCEAVLRDTKRGDGGFSQAWQDWILYRNFFANQTEGFYLDIGANEAITISNTAFFDICLGWQGVCFEPQAQYHRRLKSERSCTLVRLCPDTGHEDAYIHPRRMHVHAAPW